tara:strand:+ start:1144 stop:1311 length:168 start_codon:yes stop_codon:yes gene_type:complete
MDKMMKEWVKMIHYHDKTRTSWTERQKNASALRAKFEGTGTFPIDNANVHDKIKN